MIADSVPWREALLKVAAALERRAVMTRWTTRTGFLVERDLMVGMFTVRRLVESAKTSSLLPLERVSFGMHPLTGRVPGIYDRSSYWEFYNMDSKRQTELTVRELVSLFIHSFVLEFYPSSEHGPATIWVVSERDRHKWLYSIQFARVAALFRRVGDEDVIHTEGSLDQTIRRLSQHDYVDAGLARYDPYPFIANPVPPVVSSLPPSRRCWTDWSSAEHVCHEVAGWCSHEFAYRSAYGLSCRSESGFDRDLAMAGNAVVASPRVV